MAHRATYSGLQIGLHWLIAIVIAAGYLTGDGMGQPLKARLESGATGFEGNTPHVWLGTAVFALVLLRIVVRLVQGAPEGAGNGGLADRLAAWGHRVLYLLMIVVPAAGAATWYFGIEAAGEPHEVLSNLLVLVALGHALAAIGHHVLLKDGVLARMIPALRPRT